MAGIYLHVPFCKQACHYCDFHFSTNTQRREDMVRALAKELTLQRDYLAGETVQTIYLGGGTPSLLAASELALLLATVHRQFPVATQPEVTLEANPDDLNPAKLKELRAAGINRLSIGIQSFHEPHLRYLNRAHGADEAVRCVQQAQDAGFSNISIDLIYAIPAEDHRIWEKDLAQAVALRPQHIASYCLTIEEKTVFGRWQQQGKLRTMGDVFAAEQFELLLATLTAADYDPYEVSNFCRPGYYAKHNTSYWQNQNYLGVGPSAHSYDGVSRQYNVANNAKYLRAIADGLIPFEREVLSRHDQINERIMTGLRTKWGCDLAGLKNQLHYDLYETHRAYINQLVKEGKAVVQEDHLILTSSGRLVADGIAEAFFLIDADEVVSR
ncbi:MAG: radical SAM family heme chaperone HemW [Tunicatimonas sp.]